MRASQQCMKLLLIEDNDDHAELVQRHLGRMKPPPGEVQRTGRLSDGIAQLADREFDVILLDLSLPDSEATQTLSRIIDHAPRTPVVVLTTIEDLELATRSVKQGAQDFLVKSKLSSDMLYRSIRYAIERKETQSKLQRYAERLERSNHELQQFAHTIAHEVRSPLSVVTTFCAILEHKYGELLDDQTKEYLESTLSAVAGLDELVNELLQFASAECENKPLEPTDAEAALQEAISGLRVAIMESGATITHAPLPTVLANATQLRQLLQNLIGNAVKYRGARPPRIHISTSSSGNCWTFSVKDNGIGIEASDLQRVFNMFERGLGSEKYTGTGIGLAFCKRIIDQHGGRIWIESQPGEGSTVHFTLKKCNSKPNMQEDSLAG